MNERRKLAASIMLMSLVGGAYWGAYFLFAASALSADYAPGAAPPHSDLVMKARVVVIGGFVLFAVLVSLWRRFDRWFVPEGAGDRKGRQNTDDPR